MHNHGCGCGCSHTHDSMTEDVISPKDLTSALSALGYVASENGNNAVNVAETINGQAYKIVLLLSENRDSLIISCQVGEMSEIGEDVTVQRDFLFACVNANDVIAPFATSLITPEDGASGDDTEIILINRVPSGDFNSTELAFQMNAIRKAVIYYNQHVRAFIPSVS